MSHNPYAAPLRRDSSMNTSGWRATRGGWRRLFKFPQMDFEIASWELSNIIIRPKLVIRNLTYYTHTKAPPNNRDPALLYLVLALQLLTSFAWSLGYAAPALGQYLQVAFVFVFVQGLGLILGVAGATWFLVPRVFGKGGVAERWGGKIIGRGRRSRGLFGVGDAGGGIGGDEGKGAVDFWYCFDIALRALVPVYTNLSLLQFLLLPMIQPQTWHDGNYNSISTFLANSLFLVTFLHVAYIAFLGFSTVPGLHGTQLLLGICGALGAFFWIIATLSGWNATAHFAPIMWCGATLRDGGVRQSPKPMGVPAAAAPGPPAAPPAF